MKAKDIRIVFMGTPDFAVGILDKLVQENYHIVAVVTATDKPAGRGKKLRASAVKEYAVKNNIPVLQPANLKAEAFIKELKKYKPDLQIVVAFRMLPKLVWKIPELGTFNLHASLLPAYRGAAPINWAIMRGERKTGITTFFIDEKIDTGEIILQKEVGIASCETAGLLHDRLMKKGAVLVADTIALIATGNVPTQKQPEIAPSNAPKLDKKMMEIDWQNNLRDIYNKIRGLSPYPAAFLKLNTNNKEYKFKLYQVHPDYISHNETVGSIIATKDSLKFVHQEGYLYVHELQASGKKKMLTKDFLNGFQFSPDAKILW